MTGFGVGRRTGSTDVWAQVNIHRANASPPTLAKVRKDGAPILSGIGIERSKAWAAFGGAALHRIASSQAQMGEHANGFVLNDARMVEKFLEFRLRCTAVAGAR
jgi:hypothetical protein